jgi:integrase
MVTSTTADVREFIAKRQSETSVTFAAYETKRKDGTSRKVAERSRTIEGVSNAEINRELTVLKRIFSLAIQSGKLLHKPHIPLLKENNVRKGFFEAHQFDAVLEKLPADLKPMLEFAYITGWRIASEVLPLQWRQVDFDGGEVRLDAGTTKNGEGRVFPLTTGLRELLERQRARRDELKRDDHIVPWVFFRLVADERGGKKKPREILAFSKAFTAACKAAGCPGLIPHDLRRTAMRNLVRAGVPERVAMTMTGHTTRSVFERYNIVSDVDLREAARKLDEFANGDTAATLAHRKAATAANGRQIS